MASVNFIKNKNMKKIQYIIILLVVITASCSKNDTKTTATTEKYESQLEYQLPKVLFVTTGIDLKKEDKDLPKGINLAIQFFNKHGIPVRLEPRDILFNYNELSKYNIIILLTAKGYHDADRKFSLTYMTDEEMQNIEKYVKNGGTLITGDNLGRNYFDGTDRLIEKQELNTNNYHLAKVFGYSFKEKNMINYEIKPAEKSIFKNSLLNKLDEDLWTLIPDSLISKKIKILAYWTNNDNDSIPAIIQNTYQKGTAFQLATSDFLDPSEINGHWSVQQIENFYQYVLQEIKSRNNIKAELNPWPDAHDFALSLTFNPVGEIDDYKKLIKKLSTENIDASFVVNGKLNDTIKQFLLSKKVELISSGYDYADFSVLNYAEATNDILRNNTVWSKTFTGFRFPYTNPSFSGLMSINNHNFQYESSISVNNLEFLHASVFPYNLVLSNDDFYQSTNILEISPTWHDDYYFLNKLIDNGYQNPSDLEKDTKLLQQYLNDFWQYTVKPYNGLMVYLGHPGITAYNDKTFSSLDSLINTAKKDNAWIAPMNEIKDFRKNFGKINVFFKQENNKTKLIIKAPKDVYINGLSINLQEKPKNTKATKGEVKIIEKKKNYSIVFDAFDGQVVSVMF